MTPRPGSSSNDTMWPTLGKRDAIAKPAERPTKKARRRELRNRNLKLHLVFEAGNIPEVLEEKIAAYFNPRWMSAYHEKYGNIRSIPNGPVMGPTVYRCPNIWEKTITFSKKFLYWNRGGCMEPPITRSLMQPLLGKEILLNYTNRGASKKDVHFSLAIEMFLGGSKYAPPSNYI